MKPPSETQIQSTFVSCLEYLKPACIWFAVPNDGKRSKASAAALKRRGMLPGMGDMAFLWMGGCGLIEFKSKDGKPSQAQLAVEARCAGLRVPYRICRSVVAALYVVGLDWGLVEERPLAAFIYAFEASGLNACKS